MSYLFFSELFIIKVINFFLFLNWSSYFIAGIIFYQIFKNGLKPKYLLLLAICVFLSLFNAVEKIVHLEEKYNTHFSPYVICTVIGMFYLLMLLVSNDKLTSINSPKLLKLGVITYPLYLIHQKIGFVIINNLGIHYNKYVVVFSILILMIVLFYLISEKFEPKVSKLLKIRLEKINNVRKN